MEAEGQEAGAGLDLVGDLVPNSFDVRVDPINNIYADLVEYTANRTFQLQLGYILRIWTE